jgi:hypothetical protein
VAAGFGADDGPGVEIFDGRTTSGFDSFAPGAGLSPKTICPSGITER